MHPKQLHTYKRLLLQLYSKVKRPVFFIAICCCLTNLAWSQTNYAKNWQFGNGNQVVFNGGTPVYSSTTALTNSLGCAAISDNAGNLLFYTDGVTIYTSSNTIMNNGSGLDGVNASQPAIILKQPASTSIYYVFTVGGVYSPHGLKYSIVDMSLAGGTGSVTVKNVLIDANCRDKLTAGKHCNGSDLWVVSNCGTTSFAYCSVPLTPTGIGAPVTGSIAGVPPLANLGQIKLSPNSRKFAISTFNSNTVPSYGTINRMVADFDNATGQISLANFLYPLYWSWNHNAVQMADAYGIEFSPNSQYVYTNSTLQLIVKLSICDSSESFPMLQESTNQFDTYGNKRQFQLAPNGNIYVARSGTTQIGRINNAGSSTAVSYTPNGISTGTNLCQWGLPNFPGFYFEQRPNLAFTYTSNLSCLTASFSTQAPCIRTGYIVNGYQWNFGDPSSGANNSSFQQYPVHAFTAAGSYTVSLIRYFQCNTSDTIVQTVNIVQPTLSTSSNTTCNGATASVQVSGGTGPYTYLWSGATQTVSTASFSTSGIYSITVTDQGAGNCARTATLAVVVPTISLSTTINPTLLCFGANNAQVSVNISGGSGSYMYNYAQVSQTTGVFTNLSAGTHSVSVLDFVFNCVFTSTFSIPTAAPITLLASASATQLCAGATLSLVSNANGGMGSFNYQWSPTANTSNSIVVSPPAGNYVYTVTASDAMNCVATKTVNFIVRPTPTLSVNSATICPGATTTLIANGASFYTIQPGPSYASTFTVSPVSTINYTVTGASTFGCYNSVTTAINVLTTGTTTASCTSPICEGQTVTFNAGNIAAYQWIGPNNFGTNNQSFQLFNVQQTQAGSYTLITTDGNGCKHKQVLTLLVSALPTITLIASTASVCIGQQATLTASGAGTYTWSSNLFGSSVVVTPTVSTMYQVSGTDTVTGCVNTATINVIALKCSTAGFSEAAAEPKIFVLYPNPNKGSFTVDAPFESSYSVTNSLGMQIQCGKVSEGKNTIVLKNSAAGIYVVSFSNASKQYTFKLIVD